MTKCLNKTKAVSRKTSIVETKIWCMAESKSEIAEVQWAGGARKLSGLKWRNGHHGEREEFEAEIQVGRKTDVQRWGKKTEDTTRSTRCKTGEVFSNCRKLCSWFTDHGSSPIVYNTFYASRVRSQTRRPSLSLLEWNIACFCRNFFRYFDFAHLNFLVRRKDVPRPCQPNNSGLRSDLLAFIWAENGIKACVSQFFPV